MLLQKHTKNILISVRYAGVLYGSVEYNLAGFSTIGALAFPASAHSTAGQKVRLTLSSKFLATRQEAPSFAHPQPSTAAVSYRL